MERITRPTPRLDRSVSIASSSAVERASRSGFVAVTQEGQALGQTVTLGDAGNLFGEHLRRTRGDEVAFLRSEAGR
jgi:hypothetical protein